MFEVADDRVTLPPLALTLPFWVWLLPTSTFPKLITPGVTPNVPVGLVPMPERAIPTEESDAFEEKERIALSGPVAVGANTTDKLALAPAAKV